MNGNDLRIRLFGSPKFELDGDERTVSRRKITALIAYLAVTGQRCSRDALSELFFGRQTRDRARADLRQTLSYTRAVLGEERLRSDRLDVWIPERQPFELDVTSFDRFFEKAQAADDEESDDDFGSLYQRAADLYRGDFMAGFYLKDSVAFENWQSTMRERYRSRCAVVYGRLISILSSSGQYEKAIEYGRKRLLLDPYEEESCRCLVELLLSAGHIKEAQTQFDRFQAAFQDELGMAPSFDFQEIWDDLGRASPAGERRRHRMVTGRKEDRDNTPPGAAEMFYQPNEMIGRTRQIQQIGETFGKPEVRLVTLVGTGGIGKTRLAMSVAQRTAPRFPDGFVCVRLDGIDDSSQVSRAVASALGIVSIDVGGKTVQDSIEDYLSGKSMALLLDSFEHVSAEATFVAELLRACGGLKVLATSRSPLHLMAETIVSVLPLGVPPSPCALREAEESESVQLFTARARAVDGSFALTEENVADVAEICRRLEGLPLALELAAARLRALTTHVLLSKLSSRLDLLSGGSQDMPLRQQALRSEIGWSFDLLGETERSVFRRLSVFPGGCTLDSADAVCRRGGEDFDVFDCLSSLVDSSLLSMVPEGEEVRYTMLDTIRDYAAERLDEGGETRIFRARRADYFLHFCESAERELYGPSQAEALQRIDSEYRNIRAVLAYSAGAPVSSVGLRTVGALGWYWFRKARFEEGMHWLEVYREKASALEFPDDTAKISYHMGWMTMFGGQVWGVPEGKEFFRESETLWLKTGNVRGVALSRAWLSWKFGGYEAEEDRKMADESVALARESGDPWALSLCLKIANANLEREDLHTISRTHALNEAIELARTADDPFLVVQALSGMGDICLRAGDGETAMSSYGEALSVAQDIQDPWSISYNTYCLGEGYLMSGDEKTARGYFSDGLAFAADCGSRGFLGWFAGGLYMWAKSVGSGDKALRFGAYSESVLNPNSGYHPEIAESLGIDPERGESEWRTGRSMTVDELLEYARVV